MAEKKSIKKQGFFLKLGHKPVEGTNGGPGGRNPFTAIGRNYWYNGESHQKLYTTNPFKNNPYKTHLHQIT